jgi:mannose-6-phosphate isomerase-like protein (cupin superfamily)
MIETRPWGNYQILLEDNNCKVKKISVNPGQKLSLQSHEKRNELWEIIDGDGEVTLNSDIKPVFAGITIHIPKKTIHRVENTGNKMLIFIEIQTGEYFGEDDIVRYEDIYGRV